MRCDAAVAEKPAGEEAAGEQFEYQAEVRLDEIFNWRPSVHLEFFFSGIDVIRLPVIR